MMILPARRSPGKSPEDVYKYFLQEWEISRKLGLARRAFCVSRSTLPAQLQPEAIEIGTAENPALFDEDIAALYD
ncbi:MAG TPA: hypothetical protein PLL10_04535, partial [Elusimicrobiales bacterium]|nr:hypothetical protein [Elusimicrobiales bacterium]